MTRSLNIYAHDVALATWEAFVAEVEASFAKLRTATGGATAGGSIYDSHATPPNRNL